MSSISNDFIIESHQFKDVHAPQYPNYFGYRHNVHTKSLHFIAIALFFSFRSVSLESGFQINFKAQITIGIESKPCLPLPLLSLLKHLKV